MGHWALIIIMLTTFIQITSAQADFNKKFLASKGTWEYPVKEAHILNANDNCLECDPNNTLTFLSDSSYPVAAVFDGVVVLVNRYDDVYMIVTKYGDYFIGYSNLASCVVKKGDRLESGTLVGTAAEDLDEGYGVDIMLSGRDGYINPSAWFVSKKPSQ